MLQVFYYSLIYPKTNYPKKCSIKVARYETNEDDPERNHLKQTFTIEGPLYLQIHECIKKVKEILSEISIWTTDGLKCVEYPPEALWELLVNAVIHRDYSISDDIQVLIFNDRVEIKSPGRFPGHITKENILDQRHSRNTKIVRTLSRYPNPPNKDMGEGLNTAFQKMKEWKLKDPTIEEQGNYVVATLPHTSLARPEELVIEFIEKHGQITNRQAREITGIRSENAMKNVFYKLRDSNQIEMIPDLRGSKAAWRFVAN